MRDDAAVRAALLASSGVHSEEDIARKVGCGAAIAFRVFVVRRAASAELVAWWTEGLLTLRQVERIAMSDPFDADAQREAASTCSATIRARLRSVQ